MMSYTFNMQQQMDNGYTHDPYDTVEESMPFDSSMDLSWVWSQGPNAEFLDAAGGITLQNYQNSWA